MHQVYIPIAYNTVKDFCVARFLHIGTIEGTTLAKINLE